MFQISIADALKISYQNVFKNTFWFLERELVFDPSWSFPFFVYEVDKIHPGSKDFKYRTTNKSANWSAIALIQGEPISNTLKLDDSSFPTV